MTLLEILIALVILGILTTVLFRTMNSSITDMGRASNNQAEVVAVERTVENLRRQHSASHLRGLDSSGTDSSSGVRIQVHVKGGAPPSSISGTWPCDSVAEMTVSAKRQNSPDSLRISTYLFAKAP
jgi:type II secretory pathway pseudopilin PulG